MTPAELRDLSPDILRTHNLLPGGATFETQLTASGDGDYFRQHNDNGSPDAATRVVTYVWYFHQEPKPYTGGEIRLYDMEDRSGHWHAVGTHRDIEILHNLLVVFPSYQLHEVLPVTEPEKQFENSRFTLNGWVRRPG